MWLKTSKFNHTAALNNEINAPGRPVIFCYKK
ncbi:hypothetical protein NIASO_18795 [Niabella soli DSM 19437]|uniref:Uncharacterized protein n=1 Tax=Niabella soli DSM 19437 TaxID=929713 RepID=W0F4L4_9BACT|nr:hypothetical protein NIASO_18795 [Niabella soli DSM 19437]